jgi:apolipoprotein N-acyltransferase
MKSKLPAILLALYLVEFVALAIRPYDRGVWMAENAPIVMIVAFLVFTYRRFPFSNLAYALMSALLFLHTIGGLHLRACAIRLVGGRGVTLETCGRAWGQLLKLENPQDYLLGSGSNSFFSCVSVTPANISRRSLV